MGDDETTPGAPAGPVRIEATPGHRRAATLGQCVVVLLMAGLLAAAMRIVAHFWLVRDDPEIRRLLWFFTTVLTLAGLTLGWLIILLHDLVKLAIEVGPAGVRVERLLQPFRASWEEVREIGVVRARGHLTLRTARGSVTATARLLGAAPFAALLAALEAYAAPAVHEWSPWAAARRQLLLLTVPTLGLGFLLLVSRRIWRGRRSPGGPPR
jgi:hypothetical protein